MKKFTFVIAMLLALSAPIAYATIHYSNTLVGLIFTLEVSELSQLNFGKIERPSSGSVTITVDNSDVVSGTATIIDSSSAENGRYRVRGSAVADILIEASDDTNVTGITFTSIKAKYDSGSEEEILGAQAGPYTGPGQGGGTLLEIGATLNVASTVTEGTKSPQFTLTITYD